MKMNLLKALLGAALSLALIFALGACGSEEDDNYTDDSGTTEPVGDASISNPPTLAMVLPSSLTSGATTPAGPNALMVNAAEGDEPTCDFGGENDPFDNGYAMTKFMVSLSQSQSCIADWMIKAITGDAAQFAGQGKIEIGDDNAQPDDPTHIQLEKSADGNTVQLWLFFGATAEPGFYLTWTNTSATDSSGQIIWGFTDNSDDDGGPDAIRTDFTRTEDEDTNVTYMRFGAANDMKMDGFRVDVVRSGKDTAAEYTAAGRLGMGGQWDDTRLPPALTYETPVITMNTVTDADGLGGAKMNMEHSILPLGPVYDQATAETNKGVWDNCAAGVETANPDVTDEGEQQVLAEAACGEEPPIFNLGTYDVTYTDFSYFSAVGAEQWVSKGPTAATYMNNAAGDNDRWGIAELDDDGAEIFNILDIFMGCLEDGNYDFVWWDGSTINFCDLMNSDSDQGLPNMNLGDGYFTDANFTDPNGIGGPCLDTDGSDCLEFIDQIYDMGWMIDSINPTTAEPNDFRKTYFDSVVPLASVWPEGSDGSTTFAIPAAP